MGRTTQTMGRTTQTMAGYVKSVKVGCCGFPVARGEYFNRLRTVEVQTTFYQPPSLKTAVRWREEAPSDFEFTLKAWQLITHEPSSPTYRRLRAPLEEPREDFGHFKPTPKVWDAWLRTREVALALGAKVVVFQCPARFKPTAANKDNLLRFFGRICEREFAFVWEPRGDWTNGEIAELCRELDLVHGVDPFQREPVTEGLFYFRLHGLGGYKHKYSDFELGRLAKQCQQRKSGYCMFNNAYMLDDAERFMRIIEGI